MEENDDDERLDGVSTDFFDILTGHRSYISVVALAAWDNVVGTIFLKLWRNSRGQNEQDEVTPEAVKVVVDHALKTEMSGQFSGMQTKFYCLKNYNVIAIAFLFIVTRVNMPASYGGELFSLTLILPLNELSEWLSRHSLLVDKMKAILEFNLIPIIRKLAGQSNFRMNATCLEGAIRKFSSWDDSIEINSLRDLPVMHRLHIQIMKPRDLFGFIQLANSIKYHSIPDPDNFTINESYFGLKFNDSNSYKIIHFLERAISAFLCRGGYAIVVGRRLGTIQKMMKTLSYFMLPNERRMSRMMTQDTVTLDFQSGLFVQGFVHEADSKFLPSISIELTNTAYRPVIIDVTKLEVQKISEPIADSLQQDATDSMSSLLEGAQKTLTYTRERFSPTLECAPLIHSLLSILAILPHHGRLREYYISHYMRLLNRKAVTIMHYVDENWTPMTDELDPAILMKELSITNGSDLRLLLGMASKKHPSIVTKVLPVDYQIPKFEYISALVQAQ